MKVKHVSPGKAGLIVVYTRFLCKYEHLLPKIRGKTLPQMAKKGGKRR